jgi:hypothetical protein
MQAAQCPRPQDDTLGYEAVGGFLIGVRSREILPPVFVSAKLYIDAADLKQGGGETSLSKSLNQNIFLLSFSERKGVHEMPRSVLKPCRSVSQQLF